MITARALLDLQECFCEGFPTTSAVHKQTGGAAMGIWTALWKLECGTSGCRETCRLLEALDRRTGDEDGSMETGNTAIQGFELIDRCDAPI